MKIALCTDGSIPDWLGVLIDGFSLKGHQVVLASSPESIQDEAFHLGWIRPVPEMREEERPYKKLALNLERLGIPFVNSAQSGRIYKNKYFSQKAFLESGLTPPKAHLVDFAPNNLSYPQICKPLSLSRGEGVILVESIDQAKLHQLNIGHTCLVQDFVLAKRCIRVVASQDRVASVYEKKTRPGEVVASVHMGAKRIPISEVSNQISEMANQMVGSVLGSIMGVDILEDENNQLWPLEANGSFAFDPFDSQVVDLFVSKAEEKSLRSPIVFNQDD